MSTPITADLQEEASAPAGGRGRWLGLSVISLAVSLIVVDATIVSVLLPRVVDDIGLRATQAEWLTSVYSLVFAALMISFGRLADVYGRRRMFVLGTTVFVVASLLVAVSGTAVEIIGARAVQGVGAAMIMPATLSTVNSLFHGRDRAVAFGIWGSMIGVLSALGLGALVFGLIEGQTYGWWAPAHAVRGWPLSPVPLALAASVLLLVTFVLVERSRARMGRPVMLDLRLFRIASFRRGNAAASLISVGELGLLFILPLFLQGAHGDSPLQICVAILPLAVGSFLSGGSAPHLSRRIGAARFVQYGMALEFAAVLAIGLTTHAGTTGFGLAPWMLVYGIGLGMTSAQLTNVSLAEVPAGQSGQASGTQSTSRQIGSALGIACVGTVFATSLGHAMQARTGDAAAARELQGSIGTKITELDPERTHAAVESLAVATGHAALVTAAILAVGLVMTLRLRGKEL